MNDPDRGPLPTFLAVLFGLLAISDLTKPLQASFGAGLRPGFVLFGHRLSGTANAVVGPLFGLYLFVYAAGIWRMRRWAVPMGAVYAAYTCCTPSAKTTPARTSGRRYAPSSRRQRACAMSRSL